MEYIRCATGVNFKQSLLAGNYDGHDEMIVVRRQFKHQCVLGRPEVQVKREQHADKQAAHDDPSREYPMQEFRESVRHFSSAKNAKTFRSASLIGAQNNTVNR